MCQPNTPSKHITTTSANKCRPPKNSPKMMISARPTNSPGLTTHQPCPCQLSFCKTEYLTESYNTSAFTLKHLQALQTIRTLLLLSSWRPYAPPVSCAPSQEIEPSCPWPSPAFSTDPCKSSDPLSPFLCQDSW